MTDPNNPFANYTSWTLGPNGYTNDQGNGVPLPAALGGTASPSGGTAPLSSDQQGAEAIITQYLTDWGLGDLAGQAHQIVVDNPNANSDVILLNLEQTPEFKARFSGNDARGKAGLPKLTPAEYIATERSYQQVMNQYGIPDGFWNSQADMAKLIANDMSPDELKTRAQDAQAVWLSTDPNVKQAWQSMYGLSDGAAIASILDPTTALPIVQRMTTASQIGGAAVQNGFGVDKTRYEQYADMGVTAAQAQKGFAQMGQTFGTEQQLASRFGTNWSQSQAEQADLGLSGAAAAKQNDMYDAEKALFGARGSADQNTNSTRASGSY